MFIKRERKRLECLVYLSWLEEGSVRDEHSGCYVRDRVRAIALCDVDGWFDVGINCLRDGDMGSKGDDGVYERLWYGDAISAGLGVSGLRCATMEEVKLYNSHVDLDGFWECHGGYIRSVKSVCGENFSYELVEFVHFPWWRRLFNRVFRG